MIVSGDWVTPRLHGEPWFEKPVLFYWLAGFTYKILGVSELAARLPSALAGLLGLFAVLLIGWHWMGLRGGLAASLILAACPLYYSLARAASTDMLLTAGTTLSILGCYFTWFGTERSRRPSNRFKKAGPYVFSAFLGLAVLAKGPVALILVLMSLIGFSLLNGTAEWIGKVLKPGAVMLGLAVFLPWYVACYLQNGWPFIQEFLLNHNFARFATDRYEHSQPLWFYFVVVLAGGFPWSIQVFSASGRHIRRLWQKPLVGLESENPNCDSRAPFSRFRLDQRESFFWICAMVPFCFFSISRSKLPGYILPIFPWLALLIAREWLRFWDGPRSARRQVKSPFFWQAALVFGLGLTILFLSNRIDLPKGYLAGGTHILIVLVGAAAIWTVVQSRSRVLFGIYLVGIAGVSLLITERIMPRLDAVESSRDLAAAVRESGFVGEPVLIYQLSRRVEYGLGFYLNTRTQLIYSEADVNRTNQGRVILITQPCVDVDSLLPGAQIESEIQFMDQKIVHLKFRSRPSVSDTKRVSKKRPDTRTA